MDIKRKIWLGLTCTASLGLVQAGENGESGESGEGGEQGAAMSSDFPGGTFDSALEKVLAGEGGEGGIGIVKSGANLSIPALSEAQLTRAFSDNTLRNGNNLAYHFSKNGTAEGWQVDWKQVDVAKCANNSDPSYEMDEGECWHQVTEALPAAKWTVRDSMLCLEPALTALSENGGCFSAFFVLNKVALYDAKGGMSGKGYDLHAGKQLSAKLDH
jgi:hypothetical protein